MKTQLRLLGCLAVWLTAFVPAVAQDDDPNKEGETIVTVYATDNEASEGVANTGTLTVIRRGDTRFPLAVFYEIGGAASNGVDYQTISSMVEIPVGASQASFTITPINDNLIEGIERMGVQLVPSPLDCLTCGYEIGYPGGTDVTIYDNDFSRTNRVPPIVNVFADDDTGREVPENPSAPPDWSFNPAVFTVVRTGPTNEPLVVSYFIGGTALNGTDYERVPGDVTTSRPGTLTIPAGAFSANIEIAVIDDALVEGTEMLNLALLHLDCLWNPPGECYTVGPQSSAAARILDNESGPTNQPPFVSLDVPDDGQVFYSDGPTSIYLQAFAEDRENGYFVDVEFFEGTRSLGLATFNPTRCWPGCPNYILTWSNVSPGHYVLTAVATDHHGAKGTSAPVRITVVDVRPPGAVNIFATDPVATETPLVSTIPPDTATFTVRRDDGMVLREI